MKIGIYLILAAVFMHMNTSWAQTASVEVKVTDIKSQKGLIRIGLFTNEKDYLKNTLIGKVVKPEGNEITVVFENLEPGDYALSVIHDENENGELDSNALGIPKEGFAFGNNAIGKFGPPTFEKAKMKVEGKNVTWLIRMKYM
jgi:uncharacterized protein (DUF2141 family)